VLARSTFLTCRPPAPSTSPPQTNDCPTVMGLRLVFVSGGGGPRFNVDWSSNWPAGSSSNGGAAAAAAVARVAVPLSLSLSLPVVHAMLAGARARPERLCQHSGRVPRRCRRCWPQMQRLARPLRLPAAPLPPLCHLTSFEGQASSVHVFCCDLCARVHGVYCIQYRQVRDRPNRMSHGVSGLVPLIS